jgi:hypothetical protein
METKKIRITQASDNSYWYTKWVGKVFDVIREVSDDYVVKGNRIENALVAKCDCEIVVEYGRLYREVERKANVGDYVKVTKRGNPSFSEGGITKIIEESRPTTQPVCGDNYYGWLFDNEYVVLEPIESIHEIGERTAMKMFEEKPIPLQKEPSPQLAGIHDSLAKLALEITELKRKVYANTNDIAFLDEKRLSAVKDLTPLQLAILNAKDTPADVKLTLIVEAGRLESERQAIVNDR